MSDEAFPCRKSIVCAKVAILIFERGLGVGPAERPRPLRKSDANRGVALFTFAMVMAAILESKFP